MPHAAKAQMQLESPNPPLSNFSGSLLHLCRKRSAEADTKHAKSVSDAENWTSVRTARGRPSKIHWISKAYKILPPLSTSLNNQSFSTNSMLVACHPSKPKVIPAEGLDRLTVAEATRLFSR